VTCAANRSVSKIFLTHSFQILSTHCFQKCSTNCFQMHFPMLPRTSEDSYVKAQQCVVGENIGQSFEGGLPAISSELHPELKSAGLHDLGGHGREEVSHAPAECHEHEAVLEWALGTQYVLLPGKLLFSVVSEHKPTSQQMMGNSGVDFFSCELHESYLPFNQEIGPVNLGTVFAFWELLNSRLAESKGKPLVYYTVNQPAHISNAAFLLGAYLVLEHKFSAVSAVDVFERIEPSPFPDILDVSGMNQFSLSLRDCVSSVEIAVQLGWFDPHNFNVDEYWQFEHPEGGDLSRIGDKFIAFKGPVTNPRKEQQAHEPGTYASMFAGMGVSAVVRLNEPTTYDAEEFTKRGIKHYELEFPDCASPPRSIVKRFLDICDQENGLVAVHCKAGLGRTGTLIALWMMRRRKFSAKEAIAWVRIARPGSVIGSQQLFLQKCERRPWEGNVMCKRNSVVDLDAAAIAAALAVKFGAECVQRSNCAATGCYVKQEGL